MSLKERYIRTVKERVWAIAVSLPFTKYPPRLITEMVYNVVFWLNSFLHKDGVHATISPRTLVTGLAIYVINDHNNDDIVGNSEEAQEAKDDDQGYLMDDERITIDDINIVSQMNLSQMSLEEEEQEQPPTHTYNLRHCPTRRKQQLSLAIAQDDKMTGVANKGQYTATYPKMLLSNTLQEWGFTINPYEQCIANKIIEGRHVLYCGMLMTLKFHTSANMWWKTF